MTCSADKCEVKYIRKNKFNYQRREEGGEGVPDLHEYQNLRRLQNA